MNSFVEMNRVLAGHYLVNGRTTLLFFIFFRHSEVSWQKESKK